MVTKANLMAHITSTNIVGIKLTTLQQPLTSSALEAHNCFVQYLLVIAIGQKHSCEPLGVKGSCKETCNFENKC